MRLARARLPLPRLQDRRGRADPRPGAGQAEQPHQRRQGRQARPLRRRLDGHDGGRARTAPSTASTPTSRSTKLDGGIIVSNGPCWSPDGRTFYFTDTWSGEISAYDYDLDTGGVANKRTFAKIDLEGGASDGATVDAEGCVWSAIVYAGKLVRYAPGRQRRPGDRHAGQEGDQRHVRRPEPRRPLRHLDGQAAAAALPGRPGAARRACSRSTTSASAACRSRASPAERRRRSPRICGPGTDRWRSARAYGRVSLGFHGFADPAAAGISLLVSKIGRPRCASPWTDSVSRPRTRATGSPRRRCSSATVRLERDASASGGARPARRQRADHHRARAATCRTTACCTPTPVSRSPSAPDVTIGHLAMLHGCTIGEGTLVGIGAVVLNGAKIGRNCHRSPPRRSSPRARSSRTTLLVMGVPGKVVGEVRPEQAERIPAGTAVYVRRWRRYAAGLRSSG